MCRGWAAGGEGRADEACLDAGYETGYLGGRGVVTAAELTKHHAHLRSDCQRLKCPAQYIHLCTCTEIFNCLYVHYVTWNF